MATARTYEPYQPSAQPLSPEEAKTIITGSGWRTATSGTPTSEMNGTLAPYRARGLYPNPGIYDQILRGDPMVDSGQMRQARFVASLDWRLNDVENADTVVQTHTSFMARSLDRLRGGGLAGLIRRVMGRETYGFSLHELTYGIDQNTGWWRLVLAKPIPSWCLYKTVIDANGLPTGIITRDEAGDHYLPMSKVLVSVRDDQLCNLEGRSGLRALYYYVDAKRDLLAADNAIMERAGRGTLVLTAAPEASKEERDDMATAAENWQSGAQSYIIKPNGWEHEWDHGGDIPDPVARVGMYDQAIARSSDDELRGLGENKYGARAVGQELRLSNQEQLTGVLEEIGVDLTAQLIYPMCTLNGWDLETAPQLGCSGFMDPEKLQMIFTGCSTIAADGEPLIPITDADRRQLRRLVGLR